MKRAGDDVDHGRVKFPRTDDQAAIQRDLHILRDVPPEIRAQMFERMSMRELVGIFLTGKEMCGNIFFVQALERRIENDFYDRYTFEPLALARDALDMYKWDRARDPTYKQGSNLRTDDPTMVTMYIRQVEKLFAVYRWITYMVRTISLAAVFGMTPLDVLVRRPFREGVETGRFLFQLLGDPTLYEVHAQAMGVINALTPFASNSTVVVDKATAFELKTAYDLAKANAEAERNADLSKFGTLHGRNEMFFVTMRVPQSMVNPPDHDITWLKNTATHILYDTVGSETPVMHPTIIHQSSDVMLVDYTDSCTRLRIELNKSDYGQGVHDVLCVDAFSPNAVYSCMRHGRETSPVFFNSPLHPVSPLLSERNQRLREDLLRKNVDDVSFMYRFCTLIMRNRATVELELDPISIRKDTEPEEHIRGSQTIESQRGYVESYPITEPVPAFKLISTFTQPIVLATHAYITKANGNEISGNLLDQLNRRRSQNLGIWLDLVCRLVRGLARCSVSSWVFQTFFLHGFYNIQDEFARVSPIWTMPAVARVEEFLPPEPDERTREVEKGRVVLSNALKTVPGSAFFEHYMRPNSAFLGNAASQHPWQCMFCTAVPTLVKLDASSGAAIGFLCPHCHDGDSPSQSHSKH